MIQDHLDHGRSNLVQSRFIGSFDLPWSEWSRITDPDPDIPKERTPKKVLIVAHLNEIHHEWNYHVRRFSIFQRNMRFILNLKLQKVSWLCPFVSAEGGKVNDDAFKEVCSHYLLFLFFSIFNFKLINLAEPVGPWKLTFALGPKVLHQTHMHIASHVCWAPWISRI